MLRFVLAYVFDMLPGLGLGLLLYLAVRPLRLRRLRSAGLSSPPLRECVMALLWAYCGGMAAITLTPRWFDWYALVTGRQEALLPFFAAGTVNLTLFETFRLTPWALFILVGNVATFLPFGLFMGALWRSCSTGRALAAGLCITGGVECWQLLVGRAFDVDDLLLNALGVLAGYGLWRLFVRLFPKVKDRFYVSSGG